MKTNLIKVKFIGYKNRAYGRPYIYKTPEVVKVGDTVELMGMDGVIQGIVTDINVSEEEAEQFKDRLKSIIGKVKEAK